MTLNVLQLMTPLAYFPFFFCDFCCKPIWKAVVVRVHLSFSIKLKSCIKYSPSILVREKQEQAELCEVLYHLLGIINYFYSRYYLFSPRLVAASVASSKVEIDRRTGLCYCCLSNFLLLAVAIVTWLEPRPVASLCHRQGSCRSLAS
jgi:hypothetical protein